MSWLSLPWSERDDDHPTVLDDLRSGQAGWGVRLGLSLAAAAGLLALLLFSFGLVEATGLRVSGEITAVGLGMGGATWCASLAWLWATYRRWPRVLRTVFAVMGVWAVTVPLCVLIDETVPRDEFLIAGCITLAIAATIALIATAAHRAAGGRPLQDAEGTVRVNCPRCDYSMVGLESCHCPECGHHYTIDELIKAQDYARLRWPGQRAQRHVEPASAGDGPDQTPTPLLSSGAPRQ